MAIADRMVLGAPGIYVRPDERIRELTGVPMDVAAFAGVAPRGPCRVPLADRKRPDAPWAWDPGAVGPTRTVAVPVESWDEYRRLFGGLDGGGLLPHAVASFFEQGGRRAYILRIVHEYPTPAENAAGVARLRLPGIASSDGQEIAVRARDEGVWGDGLVVTLSFQTRPLSVSAASTRAHLAIDAETPLPVGSLIRATLPGGLASLSFITRVESVLPPDDGPAVRHAWLERELVAPPIAVEVVEGTLDVIDLNTDFDRTERHSALGLSASHPRWMAGVIATDSALIRGEGAWLEQDILPDPVLWPASSERFADGSDRSAAIVPDDFFDTRWVRGDEEPGSGIQAIAELDDVAMLVVPDLYSPGALPQLDAIVDPGSLAGPCFEPCVSPGLAPIEARRGNTELMGLRLDPSLDLETILELQLRVVEFVETLRGPVALLDVPPGLSVRRLRRWRERFDTSYAAAYHPWLWVARIDRDRSVRVRIPPSAVAAGIIARRERLYGVPSGPANELASGVIDVVEAIPPALHDELHPEGINVYLLERDGVRLTAARTLSRNGDYRQLSVRRLITMLRRVLEQQLQWMVFEPNNDELRAAVTFMLRGFLGRIHQAGGLAGATEEESFYVRCDDSLNPPWSRDSGRLVVEVGLAPAEPLEFLVLRFTREGDGTLRAESRRG
jgi:hypothetical protein